MNKYLISIAAELDGHAGATTCYFQTETQLNRSQFLLQLVRLFDSSDPNELVTFEEYSSSLERSANGQYNGDMVYTYKDKDFTVRMPVAVLVTILPSRMSKDKMYVIESRTG